ncbi:TIGR00645 family protein [Leucobacter sp. UT-8R-CII-1-4]|uniref:TIGR00645 family protein n=1 Tax=Leucobacter sp. UT-8R-CII-1-4 TaxID=3040075 RepID=UPI0024A8B87F|nr:TIGR00645 family protein [Leucobacter sp. UT-8R-CII-1-4]MDI6023216.1 TIGR00645 family protein [Leucobacter sp. UT-8R-CII-1-4]
MNARSTNSIERSSVKGPGAASRTLAGFIFASRWLQAPLYLGLIIAQAIYVALFFVELWHLLEKVITTGQINETDVMLSVLALIDIVMIANLLIMVIIGGYETFVSKIRVNGHHDEPDWLSHVNANLLKVKLAISIISISSIHLLKTFIEVGRMENGLVYDASGKVIYSSDGVMWEVIIHLAFIVSALALAWIDRMSHHDSVHTKPAAEAPVVHSAPAEPTPQASSTAEQDGYVTVRLPAGSALPDGAEVVTGK